MKMTTFKQFLIEQQQDIIDNKNGLGQVPNNENVDYLGLRVKMRPSVFLDLAKSHQEHTKTVQHIIEHLQQGGKIGAPFLTIDLPDSWKEDFKSNDSQDQDMKILDVAEVVAHEGRHRMAAVRELYGDKPIETHLFFQGNVRNRHLNQQIIEKMQTKIKNEDGKRVYGGPLFRVDR